MELSHTVLGLPVQWRSIGDGGIAGRRRRFFAFATISSIGERRVVRDPIPDSKSRSNRMEVPEQGWKLKMLDPSALENEKNRDGVEIPVTCFKAQFDASPHEQLTRKRNLKKNPTETGQTQFNRRSAGRGEKWKEEKEQDKETEMREKREEANRRVASRKAISIILRREATKAIIEKKRGTNSKKLLPRTILEALHERITALRWESSLKVFELLREQLWYRPNPSIYIKLIVMLGKCKQPERAHALFQDMIDEGCIVNPESYTALVSAYSRSGLLDKAFTLLNKMKATEGCQPDVHTYSILIKSCLQVFAFDKVHILLSDMERQGIRPNTITYNTLIDAYGKAGRFAEMESTLMEMLADHECKPDVWTMNATLRAFGGSGQIETMEKCYDKFQSSGISPDIRTFNTLLDSYGKAKRYEKMGAVMEYMQKYYFSWTVVTYNVVIDAFGRAGDLKQMEYIFRLMKSEGIKPNCVTLCSLIRAYGRVGAVSKIKAVLRFIENTDVTLDVVFFNCLVDAYGRAGCLVEMREVLELMRARGCVPDKVTYSTMIKAYLSRGIDDQRVQDLRDVKLTGKEIG